MRERFETARRTGAIVGQCFAMDEGRRTAVSTRRTVHGPNAYRYDIQIRHDDVRQRDIYFEVESPFPVDPPALDDAALLVATFPAMAYGGSLHVEGDVSARLLRNILELQAFWTRARSDRYRPFRVSADRVLEDVPKPAAHEAILPLSGGLDSLVTLYRHTDRERPLGDATIPIGACLFLPGFSPRASRRDEYERATERVRSIAVKKHVPLVVAETNFGDQVERLPDPNGTLLGAALTLFAERFGIGLLASTEFHLDWDYPYHGTTATFDPFMSPGGMEIRDDGGDMNREAKAAALAHYPEALEQLVVCFEEPGFESNCGRCEKCVRTMLNFIAVGEDIPPTFPQTIDRKRVGKRLVSFVRLAHGKTTLRIAKEMGVRHPALRTFRRRYIKKRIGFGIRYAATWLFPWTDFLRRDHVLPRWLVRRKTRAYLRERERDTSNRMHVAPK